MPSREFVGSCMWYYPFPPKISPSLLATRLTRQVRAVNKLKALRQDSLNREHAATASDGESAHRHTRSLEVDRNSSAPPYGQYIRQFLHDHLTVQSPTEENDTKQLAPPQSTQPADPETHEDARHIEPPRTPKIQVLAPPDEPSSEDEIQYIGVGLGTLSTLDKRRRKSHSADKSLSERILHSRSSSESVRSDASITSGQLTPAEPMVYASPSITHENVFEAAFQRAEDKIRLTRGDEAIIYNTWRVEEMTGQPVSNRYGRAKVELEKVEEGGDGRPRWERVMMEKLPEKLAELYSRKGQRMDVLKETKEILGDEAHKRWELAKGSMDLVVNNLTTQPGYVAPDENKRAMSPKKTAGWDKILGKRAEKPIVAVKEMVGSLSKTAMGTESEGSKQEEDTTTKQGDTNDK